MCFSQVWGTIYRLIFLLYIGEPSFNIIRVLNVIFCNGYIATSAFQDEINQLRQCSYLVGLVSIQPSQGNILKRVSAGKDFNYRNQSAPTLWAAMVCTHHKDPRHHRP